MATKTAVTTAPGWWADPLLRHELRYFDGNAWTNHVLDSGVPAFDPLPVGIKLAAPNPERQPFEPPGFAGVPAVVLRKRRRRRAQLRGFMWAGVALLVLLALLVSWFEYFDERFGIGDDSVPTVPTVPVTVPAAVASTAPATTVPATVSPTATAPPTVAPAPTAPPGTAVVVVTAAP